ncbi:MAG: GCN5-related N-acetyltransferase [Clostridia bacterium]|jgi:ribosomal-protein-alanine N-acetyltransferase|nr:GCN5-related N-acetyltransferase [Clostridia bacterium]
MKNSKITYRNANMADISSIMKIEHASFSEVICEDRNVFTERITTFPDGFRVMECDGEIIGYICSELWERVNTFSKDLFTLGHSIKNRHKSFGKEIYISSMGLNPDYRSFGLGKTMFNEFVNHITHKLSNVESIVLLVSEKWANARKIYTSNGFKEIDILEEFFYYNVGKPYYEDGIIMRKELKYIENRDKSREGLI